MVYYIGHFNVEDLVYPSYRKDKTPGGACLYAAMGGYIWNREIGVISRIGSEYPPEYLELLGRLRIQAHMTVLPGETMASVTRYLPGQDRIFTMKNPPEKLLELTPSPEDVEKAGIPEGSYVHIGPMDLTLLEGTVDVLARKRCVVSVDTCESFVREDPERMISILRKADYFLPSAAELRGFGIGEGALLEQAARLTDVTGHPVVVKDSVNGSFVPLGSGYVNVPIYEAGEPVDLTGAGDSYCGAFTANLSMGKDLITAAVCASVSASFAIGGCGALHYYNVSHGEKEKRCRFIRNKMEDVKTSG